MGRRDKIFRVVVPTEEEVEIREGQRRSSRKRVFPGYILVQMILDEESWYVVRNTPGVTGFVGTGTRPSPLSGEEVEKILSRMEAEQPRIKVSFRVGETVRITEGPCPGHPLWAGDARGDGLYAGRAHLAPEASGACRRDPQAEQCGRQP